MNECYKIVDIATVGEKSVLGLTKYVIEVTHTPEEVKEDVYGINGDVIGYTKRIRCKRCRVYYGSKEEMR